MTIPHLRLSATHTALAAAALSFWLLHWANCQVPRLRTCIARVEALKRSRQHCCLYTTWLGQIRNCVTGRLNLNLNLNLTSNFHRTIRLILRPC